MKSKKLQKHRVFWPQTRPEANIEAIIEAGRVNLAKSNPNDLKKAAVTSKKLWRHPSAAEADFL